MHLPKGLYPVRALIDTHLSVLTPAQRAGLALWVYGSVLSHSACQNTVVTTLERLGSFASVRERLREWLYDGQDKRAKCRAQVQPSVCFAPLLRWVLGWWQGEELALALDATNRRTELTHLVISVLYRGTAIPVAWQVLPQRQPGSWLPHISALVHALAPALRPTRPLRPTSPRSPLRPMRAGPDATQRTVVCMVDVGLWSRSIWSLLRQVGWHPLMRIPREAVFTPDGRGQKMVPVRSLVREPGTAWVGHGVAFSRGGSHGTGGHKPHRAGTPEFPTEGPRRMPSTLVAVWGQGYKEPWFLLTDLAPERICARVYWYALRMWIELGFRALKGFGWRLDRTRRTDPARVSRHWLVLAVATLCVLACGTRQEDAQQAGVDPRWLRGPVPVAQKVGRTLSVFARGLTGLERMLWAGWLWRRLWLAPEPWPDPPEGLRVTAYAPG